MYRLLFILAFSLTAIMSVHAASEVSSADNPSWKEYKKLLENYYFLDKQKAGHISCHVSVPRLQGLVDVNRQDFGSKIIIDENLHDFSFTYDRTKGLTFNSPHFRTSIRPTAQLTDRARAENALKKYDESFDKGVTYVEGDISEVIKRMVFPSPETPKHLLLTRNGDSTVVSYDGDENKHYKGEYSGTVLKITESMPTAVFIGTEDYQPLNGKLTLIHEDGERTQGSTKRNHTVTISYQDLGAAFFPKQIFGDTIVSQGTQPDKKWHDEYDFKDCSTSDLSP